MIDAPYDGARARRCSQCGSELAELALVCPSCHAFVHAMRLRDLASRAALLDGEGKLEEAREVWAESLELVPQGSKQFDQIQLRMTAIEERLSAMNRPAAAKKNAAGAGGSWWKQWGAGLGALVLLLLGKGKFLLLGLTKLKTLLSMFAFFGVYWTVFGWPLALGFVVGIYIHEMGHVVAIKKHGIRATAPMFIPGYGAVIWLQQQIKDPKVDAEVGLAGPIYGFGAAMVAFAVALYTGHPTWKAIAQVTGMINLFNLTPIWELDGSHAMRALDAPMRWGIVLACGVAFWLTGVKLLVLVAGVAVYRAFKASSEVETGHVRTFVSYVALIAALSALASMDVLPRA